MKHLLMSILLAVPLHASQVFFMDLEQDLMMADNIFLARVEEAYSMPMDYMERMEYTLSVLETIACSDTLSDPLAAVYTMNLPRPFTTSSGDQGWESPIVNGSGMEMMISPGDTVLVFCYSRPGDASMPMEVVRMESPDSLARVRELLAL